jgi:hypothetical protein
MEISAFPDIKMRRNDQIGKKGCRQKKGMSGKLADIDVSARHVADMSLTFPIKLFNTYAPARSLQKDGLRSIHASRRLTCHHYYHQLSSVIQVRSDSKHQAQPMNQSFVAAINAATSYKPLVDPLRLARLYNHIQSGLTLPHQIVSYHAYIGMYINHNGIHNNYYN